MSKEKIAVAVGFILSWIIAVKTVHRIGDVNFMGGYFYAGWPIEIKFGLVTPAGRQIIWAAIANSWMYIIGTWVLLTVVLRRIHK